MGDPIKDYINTYRKQGYTVAQIRMGLIQQGANASEVEKALSQTNHSVSKTALSILTIALLSLGVAAAWYAWPVAKEPQEITFDNLLQQTPSKQITYELILYDFNTTTYPTHFIHNGQLKQVTDNSGSVYYDGKHATSCANEQEVCYQTPSTTTSLLSKERLETARVEQIAQQIIVSQPTFCYHISYQDNRQEQVCMTKEGLILEIRYFANVYQTGHLKATSIQELSTTEFSIPKPVEQQERAR